MSKKLTCEQVLSLINLYISGNISPALKEYIESHISNCESCSRKFHQLNESVCEKCKVQNASSSEAKEDRNIELKTNLSSYVDNELSQNENIRIKKITIANQNAKKLLEDLYNYKKLLKASYVKTRNSFHTDYSRKIIDQIQDADYYVTTCFYKLSIAFIILIFTILIGFVYLYF